MKALLMEIILGRKVTMNQVTTEKPCFGYFCRFATRALTLNRALTLFQIFSPVGAPAFLVFELEAVLVECSVNVLVSMPDRFQTIIIHLDIAGVETVAYGSQNLTGAVNFDLVFPLSFRAINQYIGRHRL